MQRLLSLHVLPTFVQAPVAGSHASVVQALPSLHDFGVVLHAADPCFVGSQTSTVQASLSVHRATGVDFGVIAPTPGVLPS